MSCHVLWKWETAAVSLYFIPATLNRMTICRVQSSKTQNLYHSCKPRCNLNVKIQVWTCKKQERRSATATSTILEKNLQFEVCRSAVALWATASQNVEAPMPASTIQFAAVWHELALAAQTASTAQCFRPVERDIFPGFGFANFIRFIRRRATLQGVHGAWLWIKNSLHSSLHSSQAPATAEITPKSVTSSWRPAWQSVPSIISTHKFQPICTLINTMRPTLKRIPLCLQELQEGLLALLQWCENCLRLMAKD